uniref:FYVE-type domain-containing protein n=2 Tax=Mesocestoides corti TaxID=53468 RepID=A0A5K3F9G9_MESCO
MDTNEHLRQLAEAQCRNVVLEEKYATAEYEVDRLRSEVKLGKSQIDALEKSLEAAHKEVYRLKQEGAEEYRFLKNDSASTIDELRQSNREAQMRVAELEDEFRLMKESRKSLGAPENNGAMQKHLSVFIKRLGLLPDSSIDEVFTAINSRLDRGALHEARLAEIDFTQQELKNQLRESHNSAAELANRVEALLAEKETLKREVSMLAAEKADFSATRGLLEQRISAQERRLAELRDELATECDRARQAHVESQQHLLERNSHAVQFTTLVECLAASLSTVGCPCSPTESGVKEAVSRVTAELQALKRTESELEEKVESLHRQFEFQFTNGQALAEELEAVRRDLEQERAVNSRAQGELEGFRLMSGHRQFPPQIVNNLVIACERLNIPCSRSSHPELANQIAAMVTELIDRGCISKECINILGAKTKPSTQLTAKQENHTNHVHRDGSHKHEPSQPSAASEHAIGADCQSCARMNTTPFELANRAPDWTDLEQRRAQTLCRSCLSCLTEALRNRLREAVAGLPASEHREKALAEQLEAAKREMEGLHEKILKMESEKDEEYEKLERMVTKMEALRQHQAKRIAGLQSKTQKMNASEAQKDQQLNAAKSFLVENRQKQLHLLNFRNNLGRLLGVDAWLVPNPETVIIQRVQQILVHSSTPLEPGLSRSFAQPTPLWVPPRPALPNLQLQALPPLPNYDPLDVDSSESKASPARSRKTISQRQTTGPARTPMRSASSARKATTLRSQSARGRDSRKY